MSAINLAGDKVIRSEMYRRRQEWEIQRDSAQREINQIAARLAGMSIRRQAAVMQVNSLQTQHQHTCEQLELLQRKFTNRELYNWMRGKLNAIYYQFFYITQSFCLMAQESLRHELSDSGLTFIPVDDSGSLTLNFPNTTTVQKALLESLSDIILHIRHTISF
ncbi:hypothetical protein ACP179_08550 [Xenorhabdus stockiae]|uniref:Tc toxin subunit A-related protein n=1 Tax=Xenorhabdus stockiae TaxID=351614 RepID=UPI003CEE002A